MLRAAVVSFMELMTLATRTWEQFGDGEGTLAAAPPPHTAS